MIRRSSLYYQALKSTAIAAVLFAFALASLPGAAAAQILNPAQLFPTKNGTQQESADALGRQSPRSTVFNFLRTAERSGYSAAAEFLQVPANLSEAERRELASQLKTVLDRAVRLDLTRLSDAPDGFLDDGLPPNLEVIGRVNHGGEQDAVTLVRIETAEGRKIWLFSANTVRRLPQWFAGIRLPLIEKYLPPFLTEPEFLSIKTWQWLSVLLLPPLCFLLVFVLARVARLAYLLQRRGFRATPRILWWKRLRGPAEWVVALLLARWALSWLGLPALAENYIRQAMTVFAVLSMVWAVLRFVSLGAEYFQAAQADRYPKEMVSLILFSRNLVQALVLVLGAIVIVRVLGADVNPALALVGLAGVAVALASQKTLENVFGGVSLLSDKSLRVGDFCRIGELTGTVESIGLRSTRIRTLQRTVVTFPNGQLATLAVENFSFRDKFLLKHILNLRYETPHDRLREVLERVRQFLADHPKVETEGARIRFLQFGPSSLDLELFCYVFADDWNGFLEIQEEILLRIGEIVQECGSGFAFPSRTVYMVQDVMPDRDWQSKATRNSTTSPEALERPDRASGARVTGEAREPGDAGGPTIAPRS